MLEGEVRSPHLKELLRFEAEKLRVPLRYAEHTLDAFILPPFRREALIVSHSGYFRETFGIDVGDGDVLVQVPAQMIEGGEPVGYRDRRGAFVQMGAVFGRVLVLFLSLEALADPDSLRLVRGAGVRPERVLATVFDRVVAPALAGIAAHVATYGWLPERRLFAERRARGLVTRVGQLRQNVALNDRYIEEKTYEIARLARKNQELREQARFFESVTDIRIRREAEREFVSLMDLVPQAFEHVAVEDDRLVAQTYPIRIPSDEGDYDLGSFQIAIQFDSDEVRITKTTGEKPDGYPHPHVSTSGVPCFGNIGPGLMKLLVEGQYAAALAVLRQFLGSYNRADAYIKLEHFDPDWADVRFDRCYETVSSDDCVDCEDTDCPYHADRFERCWENRRDDADGLTACIRCRECSYHENAERSCRESAPIRQCIDCQLPCSFANADTDMEDCRGDSPEICADCAAGACSYLGTAPDEIDPADDCDRDAAANEEDAA
jgi:hypothetical protein